MPVYKYSAINQAGKTVSGKIDAKNTTDLEKRLNRLGLSLISGEESRTKVGGLGFKRKIPKDELAQFCFYVERLVSGGVPLLEGLSDVRDSVSNVPLRNTIALIIEDIEQGNTMSAAMKKHPKVFDGIFVSLVEAGEQSGELDTVLRNLGENIRWQSDIVKKTKKVLRYPIGALMVILLAAGMLLNFVVPDLVKVLETLGGELPAYTIALINTSDFFQQYWLQFLIGVGGVFVTFKILLFSIPGIDYMFDKFKVRMPIFGTVFEKLLLSRFSNVFGLLYGSGVSVIDGLKISRGSMGNKFMAKGLDGVIESITNGKSISVAFAESGLFPPLVLRMIRLGESTGGVDVAMGQIKSYYDRDANEAIENAQAAIGPLMMLILAGLLIWVIVAVYGPLYDTLGSIRP